MKFNEAVDISLQSLANHLVTQVGKCPTVGELSAPDGTVVNLTSVQHIMTAAFDQAVRTGSIEVLRPLKVHKRADARLAGTHDEGFLKLMFSPFTLRPGLSTLTWYLRAEMLRRSKYFDSKAKEIKIDLHAPLDVQADRYGRMMAFLLLGQMTKAYRWRATEPLVSWK